jgi:CP family cyanate transporter-like MFS transporter
VTRRVWLDPVAWYLAMYMGAQSWIFYIHATWLSPIDLSRGTDPITAGLHVTLFHMCGIFGSLLMPLIARGERARIMPFLVPITSSIAACGIVFAPAALPAWLILAGLSCGFALGLTLTLIAQRSPSTAAAGAVSGMSQSVGYLIAGVGPILFGFFYDFSGSWVPPLFVLLGGAAVQFGAGLLLSRGRMALADG